jgi:hypothetical protein
MKYTQILKNQGRGLYTLGLKLLSDVIAVFNINPGIYLILSVTGH